MREREFHAVHLRLEFALEQLGVDLIAAHLDRPGRAEGGSMEFGDRPARGSFVRVGGHDLTAREEGDHRADGEYEGRKRVATRPAFLDIARAHELQEGAGGAAVFAISLRDEDRGHQSDHGQTEGDGHGGAKDPGVEGLGFAQGPAGPDQGGQEGPGQG